MMLLDLKAWFDHSLVKPKFFDTRLENLLEKYKLQLRRKILLAVITFFIVFSVTYIFWRSPMVFLFSLIVSTITYYVVRSSSQESFIRRILVRLDNEVHERENLEKVFKDVSLSVDKQVEERLKQNKIEKTSAYRVMQEAIKSQRRALQSENSLRRSSTRMYMALESSGIGVWNWDILEDKLHLDDFSHKIFGLQPQSFVGSYQNFLQMVHPQDRNRVYKEVKEAIKKGVNYSSEFRLLRADGVELLVAARGRACYGLRNQAVYMSGVFWDLTEEKKSQDIMTRFFSLSVDLFCVANQDGYFSELSPMWSEVLGYTTRELKSHPFMHFVHPRDRKSTQAEYQVLISQPHKTINFENRYRCKDGTYKHMLWNAVSIPEENIIYAIARDITELKSKKENFREDYRALRI